MRSCALVTLSSQILQVCIWDMIFMLTYLQAGAVPGGCPVSRCHGDSSLWFKELQKQWTTYVLCDHFLPDQSDALKVCPCYCMDG